MNKEPFAKENHIISLREEKCLDYTPQKVELPVKESFFVQVGKGEHIVDTQMATIGKIGLVRLGIDVEAIGVNVFNPDYVSFSLPVSWSGDYFINGDLANKSSIYMPGDLDSFHLRSKNRVTIGVTMPRAPFVETVAALRGVYFEDICLHDRELRLSEIAGFQVRAKLTAIIKEACSKDIRRSQDEINEDVFGALTDAYLHALPQSNTNTERVNNPKRVVRLAEERFMAAGADPVALADLCAAAGVGKTALYLAFNQVCGLPPIEYFQKRRFMQARSFLIKATNQRGLVKKSALNIGFTELGRFSVQYRQLFGESPSVTLCRNAI